MLYEFEGLQLDPSTRRLRRMASDEAVPLTAKPLDALIYLVEHRDELVEKDALLKALWPRVVVEENSLERCISTLRRALGEAAGENRFIATIPGRGYRFVAKVIESNPDGGIESAAHVAVARRGRRIWIGTAAAAILAVALGITVYLSSQHDPRRSAPVLLIHPFRNTSGAPQDDRLASGMTDELRQRLSALRDVAIASRSEDRGITHAIDGSLYRSGDALRIRVSLTDIADGRQIWAQEYDRRAADVIALQEEVAATVVQALFPGAHAVIAAADPSQAPSKNPQAQRLFLEANRLNGTSAENLLAAVSMYERATELDPQFAPAWAMLATACLSGAAFDVPIPNGLAKAERAANRAIELNPQLASAWAARGGVLAHRGHLAESREADDRALALQPDNEGIRFGLSLLLASVGSPQHALRETERALRQTPTSLPSLMARSFLRAMAGDPEGAVADQEIGATRGAPVDRGRGPEVLASAYIHARRYDEAARQLIAVLDAPSRSHGLDRLVAQALTSVGDKRRALQAARELSDYANRTSMDSISLRSLTTLLLAMTLTEDLDSAYRTTNAYLDSRVEEGVDLRLLMHLWMPEMRPFRRDARFSALAQRLGMTDYWLKYGPPESCKLDARTVHCD